MLYLYFTLLVMAYNPHVVLTCMTSLLFNTSQAKLTKIRHILFHHQMTLESKICLEMHERIWGGDWKVQNLMFNFAFWLGTFKKFTIKDIGSCMKASH